MEIKYLRTTTFVNNQDLSKKIFEEICDMKGMYPYGGVQRCPHCKIKTTFTQKNQGIYCFCSTCTRCRRTISPLATTIFTQTNIHLSVWLKAMYILKEKQPDILLKELAPAIGVSLPTVRTLRRKISKLRKNSFELRLFKRMKKLIEENYYFIFAETPRKLSA